MKMKALKLAVACLFVSQTAYAQGLDEFPTRAIRLVVPTGAGGSMDAMARAIGDEVSKQLGQPVIVDNRPGAGNTLSAQAMVNAPADGYTLGVVTCAVLKLPHVAKTSYDPIKDITYISRIADFSLMVVVRAESPYQNLKDLVVESKRTGLFYATAGRFNAPHLATLRLIEKSGAHWTDVPFKSDSEAITALVGGQVQFATVSNSALPYVQSGRLRALGVYGARRTVGLEAVPTVAEQGFDVVEACPFGLMAPKQVPSKIVSKLDAVFERAVKSAAVASTAAKFGLEPDYASATVFDAWARTSFEKDRILLQKLGATANTITEKK